MNKKQTTGRNLVPFSDESNDYYCCKYIAEASKFYEEKMLKLGSRESLKTSIPHVELPEHMAYKLEPIESADGHRLYEFLIEYHTKKPSEGIYYGCRGITLDGYNHNEEIEQFCKDWDIVKPELCTILNNTYPNKDFTHRFRLTDNANDQTYWLFWIQLYEDEDIKEVGLYATEIIRKVFKRYIDGEADSFRKTEVNKGTPDYKYDLRVFTKRTYDELISAIKAKGFSAKETEENTQKCQEMFEKFIKGAINQRIIARNDNYEMAYTFLGLGKEGQDKNVDFAILMYALFVHMCNEGILIKKKDRSMISIPWVALSKVFLDSNGNVFNDSLKTQLNYAKNAQKKRRINQMINDLTNIIESCIKS